MIKQFLFIKLEKMLTIFVAGRLLYNVVQIIAFECAY